MACKPEAWATLSSPLPYILYPQVYISSIHRYTERVNAGGAFPIPDLDC